MKTFHFSPIKSKKELFDAITYTHFACFQLCKNSFGKYLPIAGNVGIFCHFDDEYDYLTNLRKELTIESDNINQKYFRLIEPITIPSKGDIPETKYTYLYIRKPESDHTDVGDVDFYLEHERYLKLREALSKGEKIPGAKIFEKPGYDYIKLYNSKIDAACFVSAKRYN